MFFQQNPLYAVIFIGIFITGYLYIKSKRLGSSGFFGFMKGGQHQESNFNDIITLMMLQQFFNNNSQAPERVNDNEEKSNEEQIEQTKQEILELLDE